MAKLEIKKLYLNLAWKWLAYDWLSYVSGISCFACHLNGYYFYSFVAMHSNVTLVGNVLS